MWIIYALLSAVFASIMTVTLKIGLKDMNPFLNLTFRTLIVFVFCLLVSLINNSFKDIKTINTKGIIFLLITSVATFFTWLFYFLALSYDKGTVVKVLALDKLSIVITLVLGIIFLNEKFTWWSVLGIILLLGGSLIIVLK